LFGSSNKSSSTFFPFLFGYLIFFGIRPNLLVKLQFVCISERYSMSPLRQARKSFWLSRKCQGTKQLIFNLKHVIVWHKCLTKDHSSGFRQVISTNYKTIGHSWGISFETHRLVLEKVGIPHENQYFSTFQIIDF